MGRASRVQAAVLLAVAGLAATHRSLPPGVTCGNQFSSAATALEVPNPEISWASYRITTCDKPVFWLKAANAKEKQPLFMTVVVPLIERFADVRISVLVIGPGLPELSSDEMAKVPAEVLAQIPSGEGAALLESPEDQRSCSHLGEVMSEHSDIKDDR